MKTLKEEREAIVESMRTMPCTKCDGDGWTTEYDPSDPTGETPMQAPCDYCHGEGKYTTLDEVRTALLSHEEKVVERVRERIKEWSKSNARTKDTMMSDFAEEHEWTIDYHELVEFLTLPITDENV